MRHRSFIVAAVTILSLVGGMPVGHAAPVAQGVTVALTPTQQVVPGATFDVYLDVTEAGSPFNGFDAVIGYDPAALTFVPGSNQDGSYLTDACGNIWHMTFAVGASAITITDVLGCASVSLPGPGRIFRLSFQASMTPQVTAVEFLPGLQFFNAGLFVNPANSTRALIGIGMPVGVEPTGPPTRLWLAAAPNPSLGTLMFKVESNRAGPETLTVFDFQGRVVRRLAERRIEPGVHTIAWDGRNEAGAKVPPGVYLARLEVAGKAVWNRVTMLR
jgi:hypothetical protein